MQRRERVDTAQVELILCPDPEAAPFRDGKIDDFAFQRLITKPTYRPLLRSGPQCAMDGERCRASASDGGREVPHNWCGSG